jgi:hypothetical protein
MANGNFEELAQLNSRVPASLRDAFDATIPKGVNKQHVMTAMARLWVSLPAEVRKELIDAETENRPIQDAWVEAVRQIARSEMEKLAKKGRR